MHHRLTETAWAEMFKPVINPFVEDAPWCGWSFEICEDEEEQYVTNIYEENPNRIWSITEEDGRLQIVPGYYCNAQGHIVTETPFSSGDTYAIYDVDVIDFDEDEPVGIVELDGDEFVERYRPQVNHLKPTSAWFGWRYEANGEELEYVRQVAEKAPRRIWAIDEDEGAVITSEWSFDCMPDGFIVTETPGSRHIEWLKAYFDESEVLGDEGDYDDEDSDDE